MDTDNLTRLPWHKTAKKLIMYAHRFKTTNDEFERQIGYLLLDVGVETLFRVFITKPDTEAKLGYTKRDKIAKGTVEKTNIQRDEITLSGLDELAFHKLADAVKQIAGEKINNDDIKRVEYFHNIRNKIYHLGDGIVPTKENFEEYLKLAQFLLDKLLLEIKNQDQDANQRPIIMDELDYLFLNPRGTFDDLRHVIAVAIVLIRPKYESKTFKDSLLGLRSEVDALSSIAYNSSIYQIVETELIQKFNELTGQKISDTEFISKACFDVTYLQLAVLMSKMQEDVWSELEKYKNFHDFSRKPIPSFDELTQEYKSSLDSFYDWVYKTQQKINSWFEEKISNS